jgi:hypothetical protein
VDIGFAQLHEFTIGFANESIDEISEHSSELIATYEDREGLFRKDVQAMSGAGVDDALSEFYSRLKEVKDYYHDLPNELFMPFDPSAPHRDSSLETQGTSRLESISRDANYYYHL